MLSSHADQSFAYMYHLILSRPSLQAINSPTSPHMTVAVVLQSTLYPVFGLALYVCVSLTQGWTPPFVVSTCCYMVRVQLWKWLEAVFADNFAHLKMCFFRM